MTFHCPVTRRILVSLAIIVTVPFQWFLPIAVAASVSSVSPDSGKEIIFSPPNRDELLLANHGGEGAETAGALGAAGASAATPALGALTGHVDKKIASESLWGNMLLNMAFARDEKLRKCSRRLAQINGLTLLSVLGVSGLSLAQGIQSYHYQNEPLTVNVIGAHHPGGHDHVHLPADQIDRTPAVFGMIGSGVTIGALGFRAVAGKVYTRRMLVRQRQIRDQVHSILDRLEQGTSVTSVQQELGRLVGERASSEFLLLWQVLHRNV